MPHSSTLKIHHSNHLFHHHISFLLWPSYLSLIKILTFVLAHSDNSSSLRSLIYSHLPNPSVKYGNTHKFWRLGCGHIRKAVILYTSVFLLAPKELCLSHVQHASCEVSDHYIIHLKLKISFYLIDLNVQNPTGKLSSWFKAWEEHCMFLSSSLKDQSSTLWVLGFVHWAWSSTIRDVLIPSWR